MVHYICLLRLLGCNDYPADGLGSVSEYVSGVHGQPITANAVLAQRCLPLLTKWDLNNRSPIVCK